MCPPLLPPSGAARRLLQNQANAIKGKIPDGKIADRHGKKAIAVVYDVHAELITPADMEKFDARGGVNNAFRGGTQ